MINKISFALITLFAMQIFAHNNNHLEVVQDSLAADFAKAYLQQIITNITSKNQNKLPLTHEQLKTYKTALISYLFKVSNEKPKNVIETLFAMLPIEKKIEILYELKNVDVHLLQ